MPTSRLDDRTAAYAAAAPEIADSRITNWDIIFGEPLRPGQVILSGALGLMAAVTAPATVTADISGLGSVTALFIQESKI
jgi:hypothetical protein